MSTKNRLNIFIDSINSNFLIPFCFLASFVFLFTYLLNLQIVNLSSSTKLIASIFLGFIGFLFWFAKLDEKKIVRIITVEFSIPLFFLCLLLLSINNLDLFNNLDLSLISNNQSIINCILIFSYSIIIIHYKGKIIGDIEIENTINEERENKQIANFKEKFTRLNKIPIINSVITWLYKEGFWTILILCLTILLGFILRVWNLDYLQGADNFNLLSAKSLAENGYFIYQRNLDITYILSFLFKTFGTNLAIARIPFIILGTISIFTIYLLGKFINKKIALLSALLFAISPVAIEKASFIREYTPTLLIANIFFLILIYIYKKYNHNPKLFLLYYLLAICTFLAFIFSYSSLNKTGVIRSVYVIILFESLFIFYFFTKKLYPNFLGYYILLSIVGNYFLFRYTHIFSNIFSTNTYFNQHWLKIFFDPNISSPMQWFSDSNIHWLVLLFLTLISLIVFYHKSIFKIIFFTFILNLALFVLKFNQTGYQHSRYLYQTYFLYVLIFATGLYILYKITISMKYKKLSQVIIFLFIFSSIIILTNTGHGAKHVLSIWGATTKLNARQPTAAGNRNYYYEIFKYLDSKNFNNKTPLIIDGEDPFFFIWYYNYPINRSYLFNNYETSDKVFSVKKYSNIDEFQLAIDKFSYGYYIVPNHKTKGKNFIIGQNIFIFQKKIVDYDIFIWKRLTKN